MLSAGAGAFGAQQMRPRGMGCVLAVVTAVFVAAASPSRCATTGLLPTEISVGTAERGQAVLAPQVALEGPMVATLTAQQPVGCSQACRSNLDCGWFNWCDHPNGCQVDGDVLQFQECSLLGSNCTLVPQVFERNATAGITAGFPIRETPLQLPGFATRVAQGLQGSDFECENISITPGICALESALDGAAVCSALSECRAVMVYTNGSDGCSSTPQAVLKSSNLSPTNTFVAPTVYTLEQTEDGILQQNYLFSSEVNLVAPQDAAVGNASMDFLSVANSTSWLGCAIAQNALMGGDVYSVKPNVSDAESCCQACRELEGGDQLCNVWNYCVRAQGCSYMDVQTRVVLQQGDCELRFQKLAAPQPGWPPAVITKGEGVQFVAGFPLIATSPDVPGYTRYLGASLWGQPGYDCPGTLTPGRDSCIHNGSLPQLAAYCNDDSDCAAFVYKPGGGLLVKGGFAYYRHPDGANTSGIIMAPSSILYLREGGAPQGGGSLSGGAIAGIVIGALAGVALLVLGGWFLWRRRKRRLAAGPADPETVAGKVGKLASSDGIINGVMPASNGDSGDSGVTGVSLFNGVTTAGNSGGSAQPITPLAGASAAKGFVLAGASFRPPAASPFAQMAQSHAPSISSGAPSHADAGSSFNSGGITPARPGGSAPASGGSGIAPDGSAALREGEAARAAQLQRQQNREGRDRDDNRSAILLELVEHRAGQLPLGSGDPAKGSASNSAGSGAVTPQLVIAALPPSLRDWVLPRESVQYLVKPDGEPALLGEGASGRVYKAIWNGEVVAAKEIDIGRSLDSQGLFVREAASLVMLRHANVVAFYGCCLDKASGILVCEFCEGRDLYSVLQLQATGTQQRLFGWYRRGRRVALEVARAVNYLHSKNVVHMDIKSSNVLLSASGTAKLGDVGLSRLQNNTVLSDLSMVGTFSWAAPEILMGGTNCTRAVDIYSFGVLLWEIITGERPLRGNLRLPRVPEECPQGVVDLMLQCLQLNPTNRPTSQQLMRRLAELLGLEGASSPSLDRLGSQPVHPAAQG